MVIFSERDGKAEQINNRNYQIPFFPSSVDGEKYLNLYYPIQERSEIKTLCVSNRRLTGFLKLVGFANLKELDCSKNEITKLDLSDCLSLEKINCSDNHLINIIFSPNFEKLIVLDIGGNKLPFTDLSLFSNFINLQRLRVGHNLFYG